MTDTLPTNTDDYDPEAIDALLSDGITDPLAELWSARPVLRHIRDAAWNRARSAPAVFGCVLARVSALVPPSIVLPPITGSVGSLNLFVALVGAPGTGKSTSERVAGELVPIVDPGVRDDLPLGSGEGLIDAFFDNVEEPTINGKGTRLVKRQTCHGALFYVDEGATLSDLGQRKGSTILPTLRAAWTGSTLGQANASSETRRRLGAQTYRLALVVGYQPSTAAALLESATEGTPQRFEWINAADPLIPDCPPPWPGPLQWEPPTIRRIHDHVFTEYVNVDDGVAEEIRRRGLERARGHHDGNELDAHDDLARLKVAALLGILDNRIEVNAEDWRLAGLVRRHTRLVRSTVVEMVHIDAAKRDAAFTSRAVAREAAVIDDQASRAVAKMARAIARHVHRNPDATRRSAARSTAGRDRQLATIDDALDHAIALHWIRVDGDHLEPGEARPT